MRYFCRILGVYGTQTVYGRPCGLNPLGWLGGPGSTVVHGPQYTAYVYPLTALGDEPLQLGILQQWQLTLYGSMWSPVDIKDRQR